MRGKLEPEKTIQEFGSAIDKISAMHMVGDGDHLFGDQVEN